jgi:hypothetical protein
VAEGISFFSHRCYHMYFWRVSITAHSQSVQLQLLVARRFRENKGSEMLAAALAPAQWNTSDDAMKRFLVH